MRRRRYTYNKCQGYCLGELLVVVSLLGLMFGAAAVSVVTWPDVAMARGYAQSLQGAAAWAQTGVGWQAGVAEVVVGDTSRVVHDLDLFGGSLGGMLRFVPVSTNVSRWRTPDGVSVRFLSPFGCPDSGGSVFIESPGGSQRVVIRPESGLTTRSWTGN